LAWADLKQAIQDASGCKERKAEELMAEAVKMGLVLKAEGVYCLCHIQQREMFKKEVSN